MRAKTVKRLAILIAVVGLVGGGGYLAWRLQVGRMARRVLERAGRAEAAQDFLQAEELYRQYLDVAGDDPDPDVQVKYADVLVKGGKTPRRQEEALGTYEAILRRLPGRADVRRKAAELAIEMGQFEKALLHLEILLRVAQDDGSLEFLRGRCYEDDPRAKDAENAARSYQAVIAHRAPQRLEASRRLAALLRDPLGRPGEADQVIEAMVRSDPEDYRVYLERGRYRRRFGLPGAKEDFQEARRRAPHEPEIYLELAQVDRTESGVDAMRRTLEGGLKAAPGSVPLTLALAELELRAGRTERAIEVLERGLKADPNQVRLRYPLALLLAERGEVGRLLLQIRELELIGLHRAYVQYLTAFYHVAKNEYVAALQVLTPLQTEVARIPDLKVRVNLLLARCYGQLKEPELQRRAYERAYDANPQDLGAQLGLIDGLIARGEVDRAIEECRRLIERSVDVRLLLADLLITRNRQLPAARRDWGEVEGLLAAATQAAPGSVRPILLQALVLEERGEVAKARDLLAAARARFPGGVEPWVAEAELLGRQRRFTEALDLLDQARRRCGDRVELRISRAGLWMAQGGPQVIAALNDLAQGLEAFARDDRRRLLATLADDLGRLQDLPGATRLWSRLADQEPDDLEPRIQLVELALQAGDPPMIEKNIREIERIEGSLARHYQVRYLIWQARRAEGQDAKERLRTEARGILSELKSRRPDWSFIPWVQAELEEQELEELVKTGSDEARIRAKQEALTNSYLRAIDLGLHNSAVVRRAVQLLFAAGRGHEALELYNRIPVATQLAGDLGRFVAQYASASKDFRQAEEIARKAVAARPDDFQERLWLVRILMDSGQVAAAEAELRRAVDLDRGDRDRWIALVNFLIRTRQPDQAEKAIREAEAALPREPLALALCCELLGRAYEGGETEDRVKQWYGAARRWYEKAQAAAPQGSDDLSVARPLVQFLLRTNQVAEAERQLDAILSRPATAQSAGTAAWARRSLALTYIATSDPRKRLRALALFEPAGRPAAVIEDPDDLRVLARVLEAQGTPEHRRRAIEALESLIDRNLAHPEDRLLLARLADAAGDWPGARAQFRELIRRTENPRDLETINRRPAYLSLFAEALLRHHQAGAAEDLAEVRELIGKLKQLQPDLLQAVILEVELDRVRGRLDEAVAVIRSFAGRPQLAPRFRATLAALAEKIGRLELAEEIYRRLASEAADGPDKLALAQFFGRHGRIPEALNVCESLWANPRTRENAAAVAIGVLAAAGGDRPADPAQVKRVLGWLERAVAREPQATRLLIGLANLHEQLGNYSKAEELYRRIITVNDRDGIASNNLAWLIALKDGRWRDALEVINGAIRRGGPLVPDFLDTRGVVYLIAGQGQQAIADLEAAVKAAPSAPKWFHLAQAYLQVNDKPKAKQCLEAAKSLGLPGGLHQLERTAYRKLLGELEPS